MSLHTGFAKVNITPPLGTWMTGFASRSGPANAILDPLFARAFAAQHGEAQIAIVAADILEPDDQIVEQTRALVEEWAGIPAHRLLVHGTHSHSGPATYPFAGMAPRDDVYCELLSRQMATAVRLAVDDLKPSTLHFGSQPVTIGGNRRQRMPDGSIILGSNEGGAYDPTVYALRCDRHGAPAIVLFSHAAHPVILGGDSRALSAEYPGQACRVLESALGDGTDAIFLQGCCGNINVDRGTCDAAQVRRIGSRLGVAAAQAALEAEEVEVDVVEGAIRRPALPLMEPPSVEEAQATVAQIEQSLAAAEAEGHPVPIHVQRGHLDWARRVLACAREGSRRRTQPITVHALRLGQTALCGTAAETFVEIGLNIQQQSPFRHTIAHGYSDGCIGYLPVAEAYPAGGYEVNGAIRYYGTLMWSPAGEEIVTAAAASALEELHTLRPHTSYATS